MVEQIKLQEEVKKYQLTGEWSAELHAMIHEILEVVCSKFHFAGQEDTDLYQSGYVLCMSVAKLADPEQNLFNYFYTSIVNMGKVSFVRHKKLLQIKARIYGEHNDRRRNNS